MQTPVYVDYNASCPIDKEVGEVMCRIIRDEFLGNPSCSHQYGVGAASLVREARKNVAKLVDCEIDEVVFTSGGSESDNWAIRGVVDAWLDAHPEQTPHVIISAVEHPAITRTVETLAEGKFVRHPITFTRVKVNQAGQVDVADVERALDEHAANTCLVSVMHSNNEIGTIMNIRAIGHLCRARNVIFHTDAAQSLGKVPVSFKQLEADLLTIAGHKLYAPKGIGALLVRQGVAVSPMILGAPQESSRRAGTESIVAIAALGEACRVASRDLEKNFVAMRRARNHLVRRLRELIPDAATNLRVNGPTLGDAEDESFDANVDRLPNTVSLSFRKCFAPALMVDVRETFCCSAGSACHDPSQCTSDTVKVSGTLCAMNVPEDFAPGTLRLSTGRHSTLEEMDVVAEKLAEVVSKHLAK